MWFREHLTDAAKYSRTTSGLKFYFTHMFWAIKFATVLFVWSLSMLVHAFIPQLVGFTVLEKLVKFLQKMKDDHPDDPTLKNIKFDE
jgi:cytochrome b subunit of formate dehydrogenase